MPAPVPTLRPGQDQGIQLQKDTPPLERSISTSVVQGIYIIGCVRNVVLFFPGLLLFLPIWQLSRNSVNSHVT